MLFNCKGRLVELMQPCVMGILNITPDSFYRGYLGEKTSDINERAASMIQQGASIIDIGGQSTRPGSIRISAEEELERILPAIETITKNFPDVIISVDTYYAVVARKAVEAGTSIINDISFGKFDENMIDTVASLNVPYIGMHMKGTPETMQNDPHYENVTEEVIRYLLKKVSVCRGAGIKDVVVDPGFGFGKTIEHNYRLLNDLSALSGFDVPVLAGVSRKSMISKLLQVTADEALIGTAAVHMIALMNGASILRVHDVKEAMQVITLYNTYKKAASF